MRICGQQVPFNSQLVAASVEELTIWHISLQFSFAGGIFPLITGKQHGFVPFHACFSDWKADEKGGSK